MNTLEAPNIIERFEIAIYSLKQTKQIRGIKTFTDRYSINRWNFVTAIKEKQRKMFDMGWLTYLVRDYNISAQWLLTGYGDMQKKTNVCKNNATTDDTKI